MTRVERIRVYPVKGLDGITLRSAAIRSGGTLAYDREFAFFDGDGEVLNGKRTDLVHELDTDFDPETTVLTVETPDGEHRQFDLETERERAAEWVSTVFDTELTLRQDRSVGFVDRPEMGPSVVSTATVETVASWFDGMSVESARRRLRANIEISGVPPFWEDRFIGTDAPDFEIDGIRFEGVTPCGRCVVPQRDPDTGEPIPEFQQRFVEKREATFPTWADRDAFDHLYSLMILTRVPASDRERTLSVGDGVSVHRSD